jgi:F0F1-type ATP synthase assembly protein I
VLVLRANVAGLELPQDEDDKDRLEDLNEELRAQARAVEGKGVGRRDQRKAAGRAVGRLAEDLVVGCLV